MSRNGWGETKGCRYPVPGVDLADGYGEECELARREMLGYVPVVLIFNGALGKQCYPLGPLESGGFARRVNAGFAPGCEEVELLCGDVDFAGVVEMVLDAEGASVELGSANLDEFAELRFDAGVFESARDGGHAGCELGYCLLKDGPIEAGGGNLSGGHGGSCSEERVRRLG